MADITAPQPPHYGPPAYGPPAGSTVAPAPARPKTPLRDIVFGWRAVLAVLLAGIIVGGLVGSAITLIAEHGGSSTPAPAGFGSRFGGFSPYGQGGGTDGQGFGQQGQSQPGTGS